MVDNKFAGSGRPLEKGIPAVHKSDFNFHTNGTGWYHGAKDILMEPPIGDPGSLFYDERVQGTLEKLSQYSSSSIAGLVTIGIEGQIIADFLVGSANTPTTEDAFNAAFASSKLTNGGAILVRAGNYKVEQTIEVPPGISIKGENSGTVIYSESNEKSIFKILQQSDIVNLGGDPQIDQIINSPKNYCEFSDLILMDNPFETITDGSNPIATMTSVPMIEMNEGTNFHCKNVSFFGRINKDLIDSSGRLKTFCAISCISGSSTLATNLEIDHCYFDGMKIGVYYLPNNSDLDSLSLTNCKARTFGDESSSPSYDNNSFVVFTPCNTQFINNYYVAGGDTINACFVLYNDVNLDTVKINIIGTSGNPSSGINAERNLLINMDSSGNFSQGTISGNSWGYSYQNEWFIVVGGGAVENPGGDFNGQSALNTILNLAHLNDLFPTTIILNPGIHNVTNVNKIAKFKIKGNKIGSTYPIISLNYDVGSNDLLGNRYSTFGNSLESIYFKNGAEVFQSIHLNINSAGNIFINDCIFEDVNLYVEPTTTTLEYTSEHSSKTQLLIENCDFFQSAFFTNNISLIVPTFNNTKIHNCNFRGYGYACAIGEFRYISYESNTSLDFRNIEIKNVVCDLSDCTITSMSPNTNFNNYFVINDDAATINIDNLQIYAKSDFTDSENINSLLLTGNIFNKFSFVSGKNINIENSIFNGPLQSFFTDVSLVDYLLPTLAINPFQSLYVNNCRFLGGALPLQISGSNVFFNDNGGKNFNGITIANSEFISTESGSKRFTLLDIDLELAVAIIQLQQDTIIPKINIHHNLFSQKATDFSKQVLHTIATGSVYDSQAIVQIYAGLCDVNFSDNKVYGTLTNNTVDGKYFGVYINNYDQVITTDLTGLITSFTKIYNNTIETINEYESADVSDLVLSVGCTTSVLNIFNNYISMINSANTILPPTSNVCGCLYVNNKQTDTYLYNDSIISNNILARRRVTGGPLELKRAFIYIDTDSGPGRIYNNNFSDPTTDGTDTTLLINNSSFTWFYESNKNQTKTTYLRGDCGVFSVNEKLYSDPTITSYLQIFQNNSPSYAVKINYKTPDVIKFSWLIPLYNILPKNTYIINTSITSEAGSRFDFATLTFRLNSNNTSPSEITDTFTFVSITGPFTKTLTPGNTTTNDTFYIDDTSNTYLSIDDTVGISDGLNNEILFTPISVTYRW